MGASVETDKRGIMNWFERKYKEDPDIRPWWELEWIAVSQRFPVGRTFTYLGRTMIVERHGRDYGLSIYSPSKPVLQCAYCDDSGKLREWRFGVGTWPVLPQ